LNYGNAKRRNNTMNSTQKKIFDEFLAARYVAYYHPRKKTISISGKPSIKLKDAITEMKRILESREKN